MLKVGAGIAVAVVILIAAATAIVIDSTVEARPQDAVPAGQGQQPPAGQVAPADDQTLPSPSGWSGEGSIGTSTRPFIGISVRTTDHGVVVARVHPDGPAAGNLKEGDVITAIDGTPVNMIEDMMRLLVEGVAPGDEVAFTVLRDGETHTITVTAGERPRPDAKPRRARPQQGHRPPVGPRPNIGQAANPLIGMMQHLQALKDKFVRIELVVEGQDGEFDTLRGARGTAAVDVAAKTVEITPADGSAPMLFTVATHTLVITANQGTLETFSGTGDSIAIEWNGELVLLVEENVSLEQLLHSKLFEALGSKLPGLGVDQLNRPAPKVRPGFKNQRQRPQGRGQGGGELRERLERRLQQEGSGLGRFLENLPPELRSRLEQLRQGIEQGEQKAPIGPSV